jgi:hypothetical protein
MAGEHRTRRDSRGLERRFRARARAARRFGAIQPAGNPAIAATPRRPARARRDLADLDAARAVKKPSPRK